MKTGLGFIENLVITAVEHTLMVILVTAQVVYVVSTSILCTELELTDILCMSEIYI